MGTKIGRFLGDQHGMLHMIDYSRKPKYAAAAYKDGMLQFIGPFKSFKKLQKYLKKYNFNAAVELFRPLKEKE